MKTTLEGLGPIHPAAEDTEADNQMPPESTGYMALVNRRAWMCCYSDYRAHVRSMCRALRRGTLTVDRLQAWQPVQRGPSKREQALIALAKEAFGKCALESVSQANHEG